jgi:hypothetical protein
LPPFEKEIRQLWNTLLFVEDDPFSEEKLAQLCTFFGDQARIIPESWTAAGAAFSCRFVAALGSRDAKTIRKLFREFPV